MGQHVTLTCRKHPDLRWSCKSMAYTPGKGYNGCRSIFFYGWLDRDSPLGHTDWRIVNGQYEAAQECTCPASDLVVAPEALLEYMTELEDWATHPQNRNPQEAQAEYAQAEAALAAGKLTVPLRRPRKAKTA